MMHCQPNVIQEAIGELSLSLVTPTSKGSGLPESGNANPESVTTLLSRVNGGEQGAFDLLVPLVYQELHRIAEGYLRRESQNHTLQPTALIHEAYLRLVDYSGTGYQNRTHFFRHCGASDAPDSRRPCPSASRRQAGRRRQDYTR